MQSSVCGPSFSVSYEGAGVSKDTFGILMITPVGWCPASGFIVLNFNGYDEAPIAADEVRSLSIAPAVGKERAGDWEAT
jgi:hypothetical protein